MAKSRNPKGLGHYYKKDDLFCWKYVRDGNPIYRSSKTKKGLQEKVRKIIGLTVSNDKTKASVYFENYLEDIVRALSPNPEEESATYLQYESIYRIHIKPVIGNFRMTSIKTADIQRVITTMNKKVYEKKDKEGNVVERKIGTSTKTMKHAKTVMSVVFTQAFKVDKIISENPVTEDIKIPEKQAKSRKTLTISDLIDFYDSIKKSRWYWSAKFDLATGLRRGELLALKCTDIEWDNNRIVVDESNSVTGLGDTKGRKVHFVPLSSIAKSYINQQITMLINERNKVTYKDNGPQMTIDEFKKSSNLIFPAEHGGMIKPNTYYHTISRFAAKTGLKIHPHCFRHTFVYNMRKKLSLKELQEVLGHDESTTTLDIYGDMINDTIDDTAMQIDDVFSKIELLIEKEKSQKDNQEYKIIDFAARRKAK